MSRDTDESDRTAAPAPPSPPPLNHAQIRPIIVGILLAMFLSALEQTIIAPALPTIGRKLADVENLSWVVTAYLLAATVATPLFGKLSDIYGRRVTMLAALAIFIVGSVACALAPSMLALIAARALQGFGGGGLLPIAQTVIADLLPPRDRPIYQSYSSIMFMAASVMGPVLGGVLTDHIHWSLIFWLNLPLGLIAIVMTDRALRKLPRNDRRRDIDLPGAALMLAAAVLLLLAMAWGGTRYPWNSWQIWSGFAGSAVLWGLFALRLMSAREPFIPLDMMADKVVRAIVAVGAFSIGTVIGLSIFIPLYLQLVLGFSASRSGFVLIFFIVGTTVGSLIAGRLVAKVARYRMIPLAGNLIGIAMAVILAWQPDGHSVAAISALLAIGGAGLGTMYPVTTVIVQNAVLPHQFGTATGLLNFCRQLGGSVIVAVFGAIVLGAMSGHGSAAALEMLGGQSFPGVDFAASFRLVFIAAAGFLCCSLVAVALLEERPMRGR